MACALQCVVTDFLRDHHRLQANVLLAYYFLRKGRFLEAKSCSPSAVSLVLAAGLYQIGSPLEEQTIFSVDQAMYLFLTMRLKNANG